MSNQYVLSTSGGSPMTNFQIQQWLDLEVEASGSNQGGMYHLGDPKAHHHRRRSTGFIKTSDYLYTKTAPFTAPSTDGSTTSTTPTNKIRVISAYDAMISPFPDLEALQKEGLALALARGADDAFIKMKLNMNNEDLTTWVNWEHQKANYDCLKTLVMKDKKKKKKNRVHARKAAPPSVSLKDLVCAVTLESMGGSEYNKDPGQWAVDTMAENEMMLTGGAKRVGILLREQKEKDDAALREKMGKLVGGATEVEKGEQAKKEASLVLTKLKAIPASSGKHKRVKTYVPPKKGDARLWQH